MAAKPGAAVESNTAAPSSLGLVLRGGGAQDLHASCVLGNRDAQEHGGVCSGHTIRRGAVKLHEKLRGPLRILGPVIAGGTGVALSNLTNELRKQRLAQAIVEDRKRREAK